MPVHRAEAGERKSPVFAYKDELGVWLRQTFASSHPREAAPRRRWLKWAMAGAFVLVLAGAFFFIRAAGVRRQPADFRIRGSVFVALDAEERELWSKDMGVEDLRPEAWYLDNFQVKHPEQPNILPMLVIACFRR